MIIYRVMRTAWTAAADGVRTLMAQLQVPTAGAEPIPGDDVEVIQPLGVRAKPVVRAGTEACVFELANGQRVAILVDKTRDEGAVEPADGEVVMGGLAAPAAVVHIKADGSIEVSSAGDGHVTVTANGTGEIRLNGSALKVAAGGRVELFLSGIDLEFEIAIGLARFLIADRQRAAVGQNQFILERFERLQGGGGHAFQQ